MSTIGDYKKFDNMMMSTSMTQKVMGVEQKIAITAVEFDKVEGKEFEPPAPIKALIK